MGKNQVKQLYDTRGRVFAEYKYNHECFSNFSRHSHQTFNIIAIGSGMIEIDYHAQPTQQLHSGQLALFNPLQVHKTKKHTDDTLAYYSLHLDADWSLAIQESILGTQKAFVPLMPNILADTVHYHHFMTIFELLLSGKTDTIEALLKAFSEDLFSQYCRKDPKQREENSLLRSIESYLSQPESAHSLEDIASALGYSSAHINRVFKKQYGLTLHAFLLDKKLQKAKALMLHDRESTLTEIAYEAGFYDQSHFIKAFKRVYSLSPNAYKSR